MKKHKFFWKGIFINLVKAFAFCIPLYLIGKTDLFEVNLDTIMPFNIAWVGLGVTLSGIIVRYFWVGLGLSPMRIWAKALVLDWLATYVFMLATFGANSLGMFVYFLVFGFWIYPILIALGMWIGSVFNIQQNSFESSHEV